MSTRKRQQHSSQPSPQKGHILTQFRLIAPKGEVLPSHSGSPVQHRPQLEHNYIGGEDVELQDSATSSARGITPSPLLPPDYGVSGLERKQYAAVASSMNIYSDRVSSSPDDSLPEFVSGSPLPGARVGTGDSLNSLTQHVPHDNSQLQGQDYWISMLDAPVWAPVAQQTVGAYQSQHTIDQHALLSTQQLPPVQSSYHGPLQYNWEHMACVNCPSIWRFHLESIMLSDLEDKGISNLKRSYQHLQQHIQEAHQWHYGTPCALCENLFCYHLGKMMHLEAAKRDFTDVKIELGNSFLTLRKHIQEAHGGC